MALLVSLNKVAKSFGGRQLFSGISFSLTTGDRIGLIGPNGAGKSTLLRCLMGEETLDNGEITKARGLRLGYLPQTPTFASGTTIFDTLLAAGDSNDEVHLAQVHEWMSRFNFNEDGRSGDTVVRSLSGGWQKRVALARELLKTPDLLLLDEPTNHLDIEGILWLEEFLAQSPTALLMVTHDRLFLERTVNRMIDLDSTWRDGFLDVSGTYSDYLETREQQMTSQLQEESSALNLLRRETEWLRRGAQARQTKQKARIERAAVLKDSTAEMARRHQSKQVDIEFQDLEKGPKKLIEAKGVGASRGGRELFANLNLLITPKTRLALVGVNGCGKSTLIRTLLKVDEPDSGTVFHADHLKASWFEQDKQSLHEGSSVLRAICPEGDYVQFQGRPVFAKSYLSRFRFRPEQLEMPLAKLSGGEKSRLRIAQLMLQPSNVLVLDEPTNDLDSATLDILAQSLSEFDGAVILVTHDRYFLDQVAKDILAFPPATWAPPAHHVRTDCNLQRFSGYEQWESWFNEVSVNQSLEREKPKKTKSIEAPSPKKRISFKDKHEYETLEAVILAKEAELEELKAQMHSQPQGSKSIPTTDIYTAMADLQSEIDRLYARWAELEQLFSQ